MQPWEKGSFRPILAQGSHDVAHELFENTDFHSMPVECHIMGNNSRGIKAHKQRCEGEKEEGPTQKQGMSRWGQGLTTTVRQNLWKHGHLMGFISVVVESNGTN